MQNVNKFLFTRLIPQLLGLVLMLDRPARKSKPLNASLDMAADKQVNKSARDLHRLGAGPKMVGPPNHKGRHQWELDSRQSRGLDTQDLWGIDASWRNFGELMRDIDVCVNECVKATKDSSYCVFYEDD